jgi:hypothetical protein
MFDLAICAIFNNEYSYLPEWVDWHVAQGVQHFFLYQHDPRHIDIDLVSLKHKALITLVDWRHIKNNNIQRRAYNHCLKHHAKKTNWVMVLDVDEFLMATHPDRDGTALCVLKKHFAQDVAGIEIKVYNYGHKPHDVPPKSGSIIDAYKHIGHGGWEKTMVNGQEASKITFNSAHWVTGGRKHKDLGKFFRINHYFTKSVQEFRNRGRLWKNSKGEGASFNNYNKTRLIDKNAIAYACKVDLAGIEARELVKTTLTDVTYPLQHST